MGLEGVPILEFFSVFVPGPFVSVRGGPFC